MVKMVFTNGCFIVLLSLPFFANGIQWNGNWAFACDFTGNDLTNVQVPGEDCGGACESTSGCTHFAWNSFNGGTCWLKSGGATKADALDSSDPSIVCGVLDDHNGSGDVPSNSGGGVTVSQDQFNSAVTGNGFPQPSHDQYSAFIQGIPKSGISSVRELAMFLANILHESAGLTAMREIRCQSQDCSGDYPPTGPNGVVYYGRGYIQLTWNFNYEAASRYLFGDGNVLLNDPERVANDQTVAWGTAFWYWNTNVHNAPGVVEGNFGASTRAINGALECSGGWNEQAHKRFEFYQTVLKSFGVWETPIETGCYN